MRKLWYADLKIEEDSSPSLRWLELTYMIGTSVFLFLYLAVLGFFIVRNAICHD